MPHLHRDCCLVTVSIVRTVFLPPYQHSSPRSPLAPARGRMQYSRSTAPARFAGLLRVCACLHWASTMRAVCSSRANPSNATSRLRGPHLHAPACSLRSHTRCTPTRPTPMACAAKPPSAVFMFYVAKKMTFPPKEKVCGVCAYACIFVRVRACVRACVRAYPCRCAYARA